MPFARTSQVSIKCRRPYEVVDTIWSFNRSPSLRPEPANVTIPPRLEKFAGAFAEPASWLQRRRLGRPAMTTGIHSIRMRCGCAHGEAMASKHPPQSDEPTKADGNFEERSISARQELSATYDRALRACFDAPDFRDRVNAMINARECMRRPIAGSMY